MPAKTRAKNNSKPAPATADEPTITTTTTALAASVDDPPILAILPKDASPLVRILTLPSPTTATPTRYFVCPEKGIYEFTKVAAPKRACRAWLLAPEPFTQAGEDNGEDNGETEDDNEGYVLEKPEMLVATPYDPLFTILPMLVGGEAGAYLTFSDYMYDPEREGFEHLQQLLRWPEFVRLEKILEERMATVCDTINMGDDRMYRLSMPKLLDELMHKTRKMTARGLPASMEEHFVRHALELPVLSVKREESSGSVVADNIVAGANSHDSAGETLQATTTSITASAVATSFADDATICDAPELHKEVRELLRLRIAFKFLLASYIPVSLRSTLASLLASPSSPVDFAPLDVHLAYIADLKKQAMALRSLSDNISRKRSAEDEEEALEKVEAKKRKKEEEDFKKRNTSRGVTQLAKADTSGMKKLSAFFTKAPVKKKA